MRTLSSVVVVANQQPPSEDPQGESLPSAIIVDDHPIVVDALAILLRRVGSFRMIEKAHSLAEAQSILDQNNRFDLMMLDLHLGDAVGLDALSQIRMVHQELRVVVFSGEDNMKTIESTYEYGVQGFVPKKSSEVEIRSAIDQALRGQVYLSKDFREYLGFNAGDSALLPPPEPVLVEQLSPRQFEVFKLALKGIENKIIADQLNMAEGTVKSHLYAIYRTFGVRNRAMLIRNAQQHGLLDNL